MCSWTGPKTLGMPCFTEYSPFRVSLYSQMGNLSLRCHGFVPGHLCNLLLCLQLLKRFFSVLRAIHYRFFSSSSTFLWQATEAENPTTTCLLQWNVPAQAQKGCAQLGIRWHRPKGSLGGTLLCVTHRRLELGIVHHSFNRCPYHSSSTPCPMGNARPGQETFGGWVQKNLQAQPVVSCLCTCTVHTLWPITSSCQSHVELQLKKMEAGEAEKMKHKVLKLTNLFKELKQSQRDMPSTRQW